MRPEPTFGLNLIADPGPDFDDDPVDGGVPLAEQWAESSPLYWYGVTLGSDDLEELVGEFVRLREAARAEGIILSACPKFLDEGDGLSRRYWAIEQSRTIRNFAEWTKVKPSDF